MFLLVPDHPGSPGQRAVKRSLFVHCCSVSLLAELHMAVKEKCNLWLSCLARYYRSTSKARWENKTF